MITIKTAKKQKLKESKGITLIALVITIIVLLILAGVTIATLTGDNGILKKSNDAKEETRGASVEEAVELWKINKKTERYSEGGTSQGLQELLDDLEKQKLITEKERENINNVGQITIGSRTIQFKEKIKIGIVIGIFSVIIIACLISIFSRMYTENKEKEAFRQLAEIVTEDTTDATIEETIKKPHLLKVSDSDNEVQTGQPVYYTTYYQPHSVSDLLSINSECFGWISIAGTNINYPVMHTPSNPQKYLNKNFYGEYSYSGTPFLDARCSADSTNLIIYGHHMNNGTMFADLCNYTDYSYFTEHPTVVLETKDGAFAYSVFSVMKVKSDDVWYKFLTTDLDETYEKWISYAKTKSLYNTEITPVYGQQILTLSTCYGYNQDDRILVLAVRN